MRCERTALPLSYIPTTDDDFNLYYYYFNIYFPTENQIELIKGDKNIMKFPLICKRMGVRMNLVFSYPRQKIRLPKKGMRDCESVWPLK